MSLCIICHEKLGQGQIGPKRFQLTISISVTIRDTDLWLRAIRDDTIVHYLSCLWWPWEIRSRSHWPSKYSIGPYSALADHVLLFCFVCILNVVMQWSHGAANNVYFNKVYDYNELLHKMLRLIEFILLSNLYHIILK